MARWRRGVDDDMDVGTARDDGVAEEWMGYGGPQGREGNGRGVTSGEDAGTTLVRVRYIPSSTLHADDDGDGVMGRGRAAATTTTAAQNRRSPADDTSRQRVGIAREAATQDAGSIDDARLHLRSKRPASTGSTRRRHRRRASFVRLLARCRSIPSTYSAWTSTAAGDGRWQAWATSCERKQVFNPRPRRAHRRAVLTSRRQGGSSTTRARPRSIRPVNT
ncbi:hypothetical protein SCHPADRAFT_746794 [Schizopora paradoxa]|uniref:Uncharacterized protein n=1 Tax=Schizopora paradoxa TaxID=27342 RepID=A0A0H2R0E2_9AGAM|nr:hypothetical protein SCHPADRAFT_746794 [Schizopora paradoxa]